MLEELKKEHSVIIDILNHVRHLGIHSKEGQWELLSAKNRILTHMKKEDEELYPVLRKVVESNNELRETFDAFDKNMIELSKYTLDFFENYVVGEKIEHGLELERLIEVHCVRILVEESILFAEYERLPKKEILN